MGKIRIKTIGDETLEEQEKQKKAVKKAEKLSRAKSASGGKAREAAEETSEESKQEPVQAQIQEQTLEDKAEIQTEKKLSEAKSASGRTKKAKFAKKARGRSTNYTAKVMEIDKNKTYSLPEALELLRKVNLAKFDETVELHINTTEAGINGTVKLPHGTGKEVRIAVANDAVLAEVEKGKINFDVLIATPAVMPRLARVAKVLGPRGLMPNPKNGTISDKPEEAMKKFQGGQISFKTENNVPVMHLSVGKTSFEDAKLAENINTIITAVKKDRIRKVFLKSTMSPAIKLQV